MGRTQPTNEPRITHQSLKVLSAFVSDPYRELAGADLFRVTKLASGTLYPILARLEQARWLKSTWEDIDAADAGRPARRYYKITPTGLARASALLAEISGGIRA